MPRRDEARRFEKKGTRLLESGDTDAAVDAFLEGVRTDPSSVPGYVGLARARERQGRLTLAVDAWRKVVHFDPVHSEGALALAEALRQAGCYHHALTAYEHAAEHAQVPAFAIAGRAETLRMLNHFDSALDLFEIAVGLAPNHAFALRGRAACFNARGRWEEAIAGWDLALEAEPESDFAQEGRREAEVALAEGHPPIAAPPEPLEGVYRDVVLAVQWASALSHDDRGDEAIDVLRHAQRSYPDAPRVPAELARVMEDEGRWEEALRSHEQRRSLEPESGDAACDQADALRRSGRYSRALTVYEEAIRLGSGVTGEAGRAEALRMLRRHDAALASFDRVLVSSPDMPFALRGKAATLDAIGRHQDALPLWTRAVELAPDAAFGRAGLEQCRIALGHEGDSPPSASARARRSHALFLLDDGRPQEAAALLRRVAEDSLRWSSAWHDLGRAYLADRQYKLALDALEHARALDDDIAIALDHAEALRKHSDHRGAIRAYDAILEREPTSAQALCGRGEALRLLGQMEGALDWFDRALTQDATLFEAVCGKAASLNTLRRHSEALPLWQEAARQRPDASFVRRGLSQCQIALATHDVGSRAVRRRRAPAASSRHDRSRAQEHLEKGRNFYKQRSYSAAARSFRRALDADPAFAEAALRLGMALEDDSSFQEAVDAYERCLRIDPKNYQAATNIGEAHRKNEKYRQAIVAYDRALELMPDYLYALAGRAECMRMLGEYQPSLTWFDKALTVGPRHAFAVQGKAAALNALSRFQEALVLWERALEIEANSAFARDGKAFCESHLKDSGDETGDDAESVSDSATPTLDAQGRDLTALARAGKLPLIVGRQKETRSVLKTLVRRLKANPLLLGEPGVGKTAVVEGVARLLASDEAPERLKHLRLIELSIGSLVAGTKYRGTFEERLKEIIREATETPGIVLFIDEIHTLVGAGRTEGGSLDAANILKPALARGEITVIGATTLAEYRKHFESDSALDRRFQPITVNEPSEEACIELLTKVVPAYEKHHDVRVTAEALRACVRLAVRFIPERRLPDKALDLLDEACADASLSGVALVDVGMVARVVSDRTNVPVHQLTTAERERLRGVEQALSGRVIGQPRAVAKLANAIRLARSGLRDPDRPRGVFLFVGASGVGKTELSRALSDYLFPEGDALIKLDMSEYSERFTASRLLGAPPGYTGHGEEGQLSGPLRNRPYAVVLLDEFEKAHADVQSVFLSLFDEGRITDSEGRPVHAREAYFVLTTNAGAQDADRGRVGFGGDDAGAREELVIERLRKQFRPELLNRVDDIVVFEPLGADALEGVVRLHFHRLEKRSEEVGITLTWDAEVVGHVATCRSDDAWGARPALRALQELVAEPLGRLVVEGEPQRKRAVRAQLEDGQVVLVEQTPARGQHTSPNGAPVGR
ncbi:MAG: ATP-dependent Clp protease ATP-binding subunit ClpC [Myxococcota bacterium]